jgi:hypothetical protein
MGREFIVLSTKNTRRRGDANFEKMWVTLFLTDLFAPNLIFECLTRRVLSIGDRLNINLCITAFLDNILSDELAVVERYCTIYDQRAIKRRIAVVNGVCTVLHHADISNLNNASRN